MQHGGIHEVDHGVPARYQDGELGRLACIQDAADLSALHRTGGTSPSCKVQSSSKGLMSVSVFTRLFSDAADAS